MSLTSLHLRIACALLWLWLVWGSTYLVASWLLPSIPPFALSALRFALAAPLLGFAAAARREPLPTVGQLGNAALIGAFLFLGGNGGTIWSQTRLPASVTAVMVGMVPVWVTVLSWLAGGERPPPVRILARGFGALGVAALVGGGGPEVDPIGVVAVLAASLSWAAGTVLSQRLELPTSVLVATSIQMASGAACLGLAALISGQFGRIHLEDLGTSELGSFLWLVGAGSIGALVAYNWLLRVTSPALATTYAYVNPLVAVGLGWWLGGEHLGPRTLGASSMIVGAVALLTLTSRPPTRETPAASTAAGRLPPAPTPR